MAAFYVGQPVRILWSIGWPELGGEQGFIVPKRNCGMVEKHRGEYSVAPRCWGTDEAPYPGVNGAGYFAPNADQLEPILPPGLESIEETLALWQPEGVAA